MPNKLFSALLSHTKQLPASNLITLGRIKHWEASVCTNFWLAPSNRKWQQLKLNLTLVASFSAFSVWIHKYIFVQEKYQITFGIYTFGLDRFCLYRTTIWLVEPWANLFESYNLIIIFPVKTSWITAWKTNHARFIYRAAINTKLICHVDWDIIRNPPSLTVSLLLWKS